MRDNLLARHRIQSDHELYIQPPLIFISLIYHRSTKMRFDIAFKHFTALSGPFLVTFSSNINDASAHRVASSDIRENIQKSTGLTKVEGDECVKLKEDGISNKKDIEYVDVGILGCGDVLVCLEDDSSSTGARCVDFKETFVKAETPANLRGRLGVASENEEEWYEKDDVDRDALVSFDNDGP